MNPTHYLFGQPWMLYGPALDAMLLAAETDYRPRAAIIDTVDRVFALPTKQLGSTSVIPIHGVIHADETAWNAMQAYMFGGVGQPEIAACIKAALDDDSIDSIVLHIDSPGGAASGTPELAACIRQANGIKPVTAYVAGQGCSAAYYLASAAGRIVCDASAILGSIGSVMTYADNKDALAKAGIKTGEIVSEQSPHKRPDPTTPRGRSALQTLVNEVTHVFISDVARYRNVAESKVLSDFGGGGVLIGAEAVKVGMADAVGSLQSCLAEIRQSRGKSGKSPGRASPNTMSQKGTTVDLLKFLGLASKADPAKLNAAAAVLGDGEPANEAEAPVTVAPAASHPDPAAVASYEARIAAAEAKAAEAIALAAASKAAEVRATIEKDVIAFADSIKADSKAVPAVAEKLAAAFKASLHAEHKQPLPEGVASVSAAIKALADAMPANMAGVTAIGNLPRGSVKLTQDETKTVTDEQIDKIWEEHYEGKA